MVMIAQMRSRTNLPHQDRHEEPQRLHLEKTPAANSNSFTGIGGGIIAGTMMARNSCFIEPVTHLFVALPDFIRFNRKSSPPTAAPGSTAIDSQPQTPAPP